MEKFKFLEEINNLHTKGLNEEDTIDIYEKAEQAFEVLEDDISELKGEADRREERISDLKDELTEAQNEIDKLEGFPRFELEGVHDNIVTKMTVESLFENLDNIPIVELEKFINQFKK